MGGSPDCDGCHAIRNEKSLSSIAEPINIENALTKSCLLRSIAESQPSWNCAKLAMMYH
jgi:hypothetical protein